MSTETTEQKPQPETVSARGKTGPGSRLRNARLANNQEIATIAERLHLTVTVVRALEQDDYSDLTARVFVRGYLRNYARLVNIPVETVLEQFDEIWPATETPVKVTQPPRLAADSHPKHRWRQWITWLLLLMGTVLFLLWWQGYLSQFWQQQTTESNALGETTIVLPPNENPTLLDPVTEKIASAEVLFSDTEPTNTITQPPSTAVTAVTLTSPATGVTSIDETPTTEVTPEEASEPLALTEEAPPVVTISFQKDCWTNIRDNTRTYKLIGKMSADTQYQLGGEAPYQVVLGNAAAATIYIDGQPYNLKQHTRNNVARFVLQP